MAFASTKNFMNYLKKFREPNIPGGFFSSKLVMMASAFSKYPVSANAFAFLKDAFTLSLSSFSAYEPSLVSSTIHDVTLVKLQLALSAVSNVRCQLEFFM
jgi:hypothetical protein